MGLLVHFRLVLLRPFCVALMPLATHLRVRWQRDYASIAAATVKVFIAPKIFSYPQAGPADYPIFRVAKAFLHHRLQIRRAVRWAIE